MLHGFLKHKSSFVCLFVIFFNWLNWFLLLMHSLQYCSRLLLEEKLCKDYLKKMRNPKMEALRKTDLMKSIVKKCSTMASKAVKCPRCGYINGLAFTFTVDLIFSKDVNFLLSKQIFSRESTAGKVSLISLMQIFLYH